jgi:hypothetical protein
MELAADEAAWHVHGAASPVLAFTGAAFDAFLDAARAGNSTSAGTSVPSRGRRRRAPRHSIGVGQVRNTT